MLMLETPYWKFDEIGKRVDYFLDVLQMETNTLNDAHFVEVKEYIP